MLINNKYLSNGDFDLLILTGIDGTTPLKRRICCTVVDMAERAIPY